MPPIPAHEFQKYLHTLWTTQDVMRVFRRSEMTINIWRREHGMPYFLIPSDQRPAIRYDSDLVREWADNKGKEMYE